ncbi:MAG: alanine racemase [Lachnospiraceae bacterium]|nr:alanine racemase [Lachnospiraceae bacterium]
MDSEYKRTAACIDLEAVAHNVKEIRKLLSDSTMLMTIIKADAYGHGAVRVARRLEREQLSDAYGVAIAEEGIALRIAGITRPILLLGYTAPQMYEKIILNRLMPTVFSLDTAKGLSAVCQELGMPVDIHIKLDTGMSRIGFTPSEEAFHDISEIHKLPGIRIKGIFSHFARADETDKTSAYEQFDKFTAFADRVEKEITGRLTRHIANSAAIMEMPKTHLDMVRAGIITYGMYPSKEVDTSILDLKPALSWRTHVSFVKTIPEGTPISYGATFVTERETRLATIPVGYADGYPRSLSGKGRVLIHDSYAPILGRICMDQFMVDVTSIPGVKTGDRVVLVGRDIEHEIPIEEPADLSGSFNYEFACNIGRRVERTY